MQVDDEWAYIRTTPPLDSLFTIHFFFFSPLIFSSCLVSKKIHRGGAGQLKSSPKAPNLAETWVVCRRLFWYTTSVSTTPGAINTRHQVGVAVLISTLLEMGVLIKFWFS
ncbi:hypothetical protein Sjap_022632 [Stephania japonica]|uniref:Uncharacterized protein n=1 Tax=Stephania japonica TaxID=461633 RepID=A0AAP0EP86_9MAGN